MPINGSMLGNGGTCIAEAEFVDCADLALCDDALTWGCDGNATKYLFYSSCLPVGFVPCDGPNLPPC
jgi:hypothetical protein